MIDFIKHKFFHDWFPHWSPEIALRYLPIVNILKKDNSMHNILDVGSGSLGIAPYLKRRVVGVDVNFREPYSSYLKRVKGLAYKLPFKNKAFDTSICVDTLEHINKKYRKRVISELIRVTKKKIYITMPIGSISEGEDKKLFNHLLGAKKWKDPYLEQHIKYGLPKEGDLVAYFPSKVKIETRGLTNIFLRRLILKAQFSNTGVGRFISSVIFILLLPIFLKINLRPVYRKLFIINLNK